jgi:hypothetical protein
VLGSVNGPAVVAKLLNTPHIADALNTLKAAFDKINAQANAAAAATAS